MFSCQQLLDYHPISLLGIYEFPLVTSLNRYRYTWTGGALNQKPVQWNHDRHSTIYHRQVYIESKNRKKIIACELLFCEDA